MKRHHSKPRGSALLLVLVLMGVMLTMGLAIMDFAGSSDIRAVEQARTVPRNYCVEPGLQIARAYFSANYKKWNTVGSQLGFLAQPSIYNPIFAPSSTTGISNPTPACPMSNSSCTASAVSTYLSTHAQTTTSPGYLCTMRMMK